MLIGRDFCKSFRGRHIRLVLSIRHSIGYRSLFVKRIGVKFSDPASHTHLFAFRPAKFSATQSVVNFLQVLRSRETLVRLLSAFLIANAGNFGKTFLPTTTRRRNGAATGKTNFPKLFLTHCNRNSEELLYGHAG